MDKRILSRASYVITSVGLSFIFIYSALPYYCLTTIVIPEWDIYWDYASTQWKMMILFSGSSLFGSLTTLRKKRTVMDVFLNVSFPFCILLTLRVSQSHIIYVICVYIFAVTAASCKVIDLIYSEKYAQLSLMTRIRRIYYIYRERVIIILFFTLAPMAIYTNMQESSSGRILYQAVDVEQELEISEFPDLVSEEQWWVLSLESKLEILKRYVDYECKTLGVAPVNVYIVQEAVDGALAYYSHNENGIFFSLFFLNEASLEDVLYVSAHEAYHRYEHALIDILNLLDSAGVSSYKSLEYFDEAVSLRQAAITYKHDLAYGTYVQNMLEIESEVYARARIQELKAMGYLD